MAYWIDVDNGEYGMVADPDNLRGVPVKVESGLSPWDCETLLAQARENGPVLLVEAMAELDALIQAFEGLALSFIYSPVPPTFSGRVGEGFEEETAGSSFGYAQRAFPEIRRRAA